MTDPEAISMERRKIENEWSRARSDYNIASHVYSIAMYDLQNRCPHTRRRPSESILDEQVAQCLDCGKRLTGGLKP